MAAGTLLVEEAGGKVSGMRNEALDLHGKYVLADNGLIHAEIVKLFCRHFRRTLSIRYARPARSRMGRETWLSYPPSRSRWRARMSSIRCSGLSAPRGGSKKLFIATALFSGL